MTSRTLTDAQLSEMLQLIEKSDTVELKLTVPDSDIRSTAVSLGMDPLQAEIRQVVFFDTPDLTLNQNGVVVRARRIQGGAGDTVVKLRPVVPDQLSPELRRSKGFGVEVDAMPGGFVCSASMKGKSNADAVRQVALGQASIGSLFSKEQKAFYREHAPEGLSMNDLATLGPINILKLKFDPAGFERRMVAELWLYPDGSRILELSTKCAPGEAFQVAAEARAYLAGNGVDLGGEQQTKTKNALEYFSSGLGSAERVEGAETPTTGKKGSKTQ
jgi:hypothetical protein